jgi:hypothetical protein
MEKPLMIAAAVRAGIVAPRAIRSIALALTLTSVVATSIAGPSLAQGQASSPATTGVMVIVTVKAGVARERVMAAMPAEIRRPYSSISMGRFVNGIRVATAAE